MAREPVDLALHRLAEEPFHPAQIAEAFLADAATKVTGRRRSQSFVRPSVRATASRTASPRQLSPTPGPVRMGRPAPRDRTSVPSGKTVSGARRPQAWTSSRHPVDRQDIAGLVQPDVGQPRLLERQLSRPVLRAASWNVGAGISQSRIWFLTVLGSSARMESSAARRARIARAARRPTRRPPARRARHRENSTDSQRG